METKTNAPIEEAYEWDEIREATWDVASITDDMREAQIKRLTGEMLERMTRVVSPYRGVNVASNRFMRDRLEMQLEALLREYKAMRTVDDWSIQCVTERGELHYTLRTELLVHPSEKVGFSFYVQ